MVQQCLQVALTRVPMLHAFQFFLERGIDHRMQCSRLIVQHALRASSHDHAISDLCGFFDNLSGELLQGIAIYFRVLNTSQINLWTSVTEASQQALPPCSGCPVRLFCPRNVDFSHCGHSFDDLTVQQLPSQHSCQPSPNLQPAAAVLSCDRDNVEHTYLILADCTVPLVALAESCPNKTE